MQKQDIREILDVVKINFSGIELSDRHITFIINEYCKFISDSLKNGNQIEIPLVGKLGTTPVDGYSRRVGDNPLDSLTDMETVKIDNFIKFWIQVNPNLKREAETTLKPVYFEGENYSFEDVQGLEFGMVN